MANAKALVYVAVVIIALVAAVGQAESPPVEEIDFIAVEPPVVDIGEPAIAPAGPDPAYACSQLMPEARCKKIAVKRGWCKAKNLTKTNKRGQLFM